MDTIEIEWDLLGAKLAHLSDVDQGKFFKGFAIELARYESQCARELQMFAIQKKLNLKEQKTLEETMPCLWYTEKWRRYRSAGGVNMEIKEILEKLIRCEININEAEINLKDMIKS